jgi:hypothetical protein
VITRIDDISREAGTWVVCADSVPSPPGRDLTPTQIPAVVPDVHLS